jgi:(R,R)-butanediol dehydrogenase/meso-butanediol dehydrogenase/diacetyl reductase
MPVVLGHEFCAEIVEVGSAVRGFDIGDKAVGIVYPSCGQCEYCRRGDFPMCDMRAMAANERNGSFAEYIVAPARQMFVVPAETPAEEAALIEPTSVATHAVRRSRTTVGERVVIFGGGPLGLLIAMVARRAGASSIVVVEPAERRRALAPELGADLALDPADEIEGPIMDVTESRRADVVFEVSGNPSAFDAAQHLVRKRGRLVMVAVYETRRLELHANRLLSNEVDIIPSYWANDVDFGTAVSLVASRKIDVRPLISTRAPLDEIQSIFEALAADRGRFNKVLLSCS